MNGRRGELYLQLGRLLDAGVPLRGSLEMLGRHEGRYAAAARNALKSIDAGTGLAEALRSGGMELPELDLRILEVGESAGRLPQVLAHLRAWDEEERRLRRELLTPLAYPCLLLLMAAFVAPAPLLVSQGTSGYLTTVFFSLAPLLILVVSGVVAFKLWPATASAVVERVPLLGAARRDQAGSVFLEVLGMALEVGMPLPEALDRAAWATPSSELRRLGSELHEAANAGRFRLEDLASPRLFGRFSSQVLLAAAETGNLGSSAIQVARLLREEALSRVRRAISIGSTLVYLMAAIAVGYTVIRFYTKLYSTTGL